jgi:hypothetical protein
MAVEWESEVYESESESEAATEARAPVRRPSGAPSFRPRPVPTQGTQNFVTQTQLEAALARSDGKIKTVAEGVATINARLAAVAAAAKKEAEQRKKAVDTTGKDLNQKLQLLALLPLIITPKEIKNPQVAIPANTAMTANITPGSSGSISFASPVPLLLTDGSSNPVTHISEPHRGTLDALLPLLLVTGVGTPGGGFSLGGDGGADSSMMLLALALAIGTHK